ncbi:kinase-like domain-containing protein [Pisolithus thermaeus]|nr:kinase-like domain-containing protein [Pisolithus thermaeus]
MALLTSTQHLDEIHIWSQLRHENIIPLLGIATKFDHTVSMVMQWMERGNAHDYVQDEVVDPRPLLLDIAHGLNYLHSLGVIHGDLKGTNVLISGAGRALIIDFEFSYRSNPSSGPNVERSRGGSLPWLAPERLETNAVNRQADVWAYGMTVLELFSRRYPLHPVQTKGHLVCCILRGPPSRPSNESTNFRLCDNWWSVCSECWNHEPSARPAMNGIVTRIKQFNMTGEDGRRK